MDKAALENTVRCECAGGCAASVDACHMHAEFEIRLSGLDGAAGPLLWAIEVKIRTETKHTRGGQGDDKSAATENEGGEAVLTAEVTVEICDCSNCELIL